MTARAIMKRAGLVMAATAAWTILGVACLHGEFRASDATRDTIHAAHTDCLRRVEFDAHAHGRDAWREVQCDLESERACKSAGLERLCAEWESGGL